VFLCVVSMHLWAQLLEINMIKMIEMTSTNMASVINVSMVLPVTTATQMKGFSVTSCA